MVYDEALCLCWVYEKEGVERELILVEVEVPEWVE
jgi:hypothetical protein